jgi:TonB-dependent starch-binding outer membrane protein SusC
VRRALSVVGLLTALAASAGAQGTRDITGKITQTGTAIAIPEASVSIFGQPVGVRVNERGEYRIRVPQGDVTLLVRAIGFQRQTRRVPPGEQTADFALEKDVLQLEQVVVTGTTTTLEKRNATTAITALSSTEISRAPAQSIENQLQGKVLGASINMNTGQPGGGGQIQIRGVTSILGQGDPLYVIDGVIMSNAANSSGLNGITGAGGGIGNAQDAVVNRLADLNPNEVETIEVLKSAAATAIYGSRATNGVVVIKTKRGRAGATRVNLTQRAGTQEPGRLVGSRRFDSLDEALDWGTRRKEDLDLIRSLFEDGVPKYQNFQDQLYDNRKPSYETVLSMSGGNDRTQYFATGTQKVEQGTARNTSARLQTARLNLDQSLGSRLRTSMGLGFTRNFLKRGISNNDNVGISPIYTFGYTPSFFRLDQRTEGGAWVENPFNGGGVNTTNPFQTFQILKSDEDVYRVIGNVNANYSLLVRGKHSVDLNAQFGLDRFQQDGNQFSPALLQYEGNDGLPGTAIEANVNSRNMNSSLNATWTFTPGWTMLSSATTSAGIIAEEQGQNVYRLRARGLLPGVVNVNQGQQNTEQTRTLFRDQAMYLNTDIRLLNEHLTISSGVRADRSSTFGDREKWYAYPRVSGSYLFENPVAAIDNFKVRASYGQTGNRPRYGDRDLTLASGGVIEGRPTLVVAGVIGNPNIRPETLNETEFGFDASMLNQRISMEGTYYTRKLTNQLLSPAIAPTSGFTNLVLNEGKLTNQGYEAALTVVPFRSTNWDVSTRASYQTNKQEVSDLPAFVPPFAAPNSFGDDYGRNYIREGNRTTTIWGNAPVELNPDNTVKRQLPIGTLITDPNVDRRIVPIGDANPKYQMAFANQVRYRALSLNFLLDWRHGGDVSNMTNNLYDEGQLARDYMAPSPIDTMPLGRWRYSAWAGGKDTRVYVQDGSYVKLREVALMYDVPTNFLHKYTTRVSSLSVQVQGRNLATWTSYWGADPEFNNFGNQNLNRFIDLAPFPPTRSFWVSFNVGF